MRARNEALCAAPAVVRSPAVRVGRLSPSAVGPVGLPHGCAAGDGRHCRARNNQATARLPVGMEGEPQFSVHVSAHTTTITGSINSRSSANKRQTDAPTKKHGDPFPQALDGRPADAAIYAQVDADSKPRLAEMHGVLAAPPPMLSSRY